MVRRDELSAEKHALLAGELRARGDAVSLLGGEPIAIVGMGCRFPGGIDDVDALWTLVERGGDAVTEIPEERWDATELYDRDPASAGKMSTRWGGFLRAVDAFDPTFFGISPKEAARMDPQQRLLLEIAWETFEAAGVDADGMRGSATGVFVGVCANDYATLQFGDPGTIDAHTGSGCALSIVANRLSHVLDLRGPSLAIDTACSSSLVAVHLACASLRERECALALAGGVHLILLPWASVAFSKAGMMAGDGRCKPFDARADGYVRSEGAGLVLLKRLADALLDGDPIEAVIRGSAVNQDGRTTVLTAPSGAAQQTVVRRALERAGVDPDRVAYVEAHGTGTPLGDPIEVEALRAVYDAAPSRTRRAIGSIKANLGHLEGAAGVAGLIKIVLMLRRGVVPPQPHFQALNPHVDLAGSSFHVPSAAEPWPMAGRRCAGVSSFGFGGTNVHMVLEEAPPAPPAAAVADCAALLPLSAHCEESLRDLAQRYRGWCADRATRPPTVRALAASAARGRAALSHRLAIVADGVPELEHRLDAFLAGDGPAPGMAWGERSFRPSAGVVFVYGGQGGQWPRMGLDLAARSTVFAAELVRAAAALSVEGFDLFAALEAPGADGPLRATASAQPAIFAIELALTAWLRHAGIEPRAVIGHSLGEIAAACVAGFLTLADAARLVVLRGRAMEQARGGGMVAVELPAAEVRPLLGARLAIAAENAPAHCVVAGERATLDSLAAELAGRGVRHRDLGVGYAFHGPAMAGAAAEIERALTECPLGVGPGSTLRMVSTVHGRVVSAHDLDARHWARNVADPVRFREAIELLARAAHTELVELSPHPALVASIEATLAAVGREGLAVGTLRRGQDGRRALLATLGELFVCGLAPDWRALDPEAPRVPVPRTPFRRARYWLPERSSTSVTPPPATLTPLLGRRVSSPLRSVQFEARWSRERPAFLGEHRIQGSVLAPAAAFVELVLSGLVRSRPRPERGWSLEEVQIERPLVLPEGAESERTVQLVLDDGSDEEGVARFAIWSAAPADADAWSRHVTGRARVALDAAGTVAHRAAAVAAAAQPTDPAALYRRLRELGYDQGPSLRGLRSLSVGAGCALGEVALDQGAVARDEGYELHPALLEAALQVVAATRPELRAVYLPVGWARLVVRRAAPARLLVYAAAREDRAADPIGDEGPEGFTADLTLWTTEGELFATLDGLRVRRSAPVGLSLGDGLALYQPVWVETPPPVASSRGGAAAPDRPSRSGAPAAAPDPARRAGDGVWLLCGVDDPVRGEVAAALRSAGGSVLEAEPLAGVAAVVERLAAGGLTRDAAADSAVRGIVLFVGATSTGQPLDALDSVLSWLARLVHRGSDAPAKLWLVTRGAQPVDAPGRPAALVCDPGAASVWGLVRSAALEHRSVIGGLVDLAPSFGAGESAALALELLGGGEEDQVALRDDRTFRPRWVAVGSSAASSTPSSTLGERTYLVTGGLGAIGLELAAWLASRGVRHLLLVGRGAPSAAALERLKRLREAGVEVSVASADVADAGALAAVLAMARRPLGGVVHAAGVLDDVVLARESREHLARVWAGKAQGAWNLHQATRDEPLELFLLCSSIASLLGSRGQASYAAANAYLDGLAHHRCGLGLPALAVNWGWWRGSGMATRLEPALAATGLRPMAPARALEALDRALAAGLTQVVIADADWPRLVERYAASGGRSMLRELAAAPLAVSDAAGSRATGGPRRPILEGLAPRARERALEDHVIEQVRRVLALPEGYRIPVDRGFFDLGMDSAMALELNQRLEASLGRGLAAQTVFDHPNVAALTRYLLRSVAARSAPAPSVVGEAAAAPAGGSGDDLLAAVEALPEQEVELELGRLEAADRGSTAP